MTYTSYNVLLRKELPFWGHSDCTCVKILVVLIFLIAILNALTRSLMH